MKCRSFAAAAAIARAWTWLYTLPLEPVERHGRRLEIASDLWESEADGPTAATAAHVVVRTILGVLDDLLWTIDRACAGRLTPHPLTIVRAVIAVAAMATVVVSASGPTVDPARALRVTLESAGWVRDTDNARGGFAPAIVFALTNVGERRTAALEANVVFHRVDAGGELGLGTAFAPVVGWRGLDARTTTRRVLLSGQPVYVINASTARPVAVPLEHLDEVQARLFVHHEGRWTLLGDFTVPARRLLPNN